MLNEERKQANLEICRYLYLLFGYITLEKNGDGKGL